MITENTSTSKAEYLSLEVTVDADFQGWRIDQVLATLYPQYSRNRWQQALKSGDILLNHAKVKAKSSVMIGDCISGSLPIVEETQAQAQAIAINTIHADDDIIVVDKPAGLVVHPAVGNPDGTLLNALLYHYPELSALPRAGIVHRLDKDTSGLMVVARSLNAHTHLVKQLQSRDMGRLYLALVYRYVTAGDSIDLPIGRHHKERVKMAVREDGKPAITHFRIEERFDELTLLRVKLETGRTHQIRVHLAARQHPLVGDSVYGGNAFIPKGLSDTTRAALSAFPRQALHASELHLKHPADDAIHRFHSQLAPDIEALLTQLRT